MVLLLLLNMFMGHMLRLKLELMSTLTANCSWKKISGLAKTNPKCNLYAFQSMFDLGNIEKALTLEKMQDHTSQDHFCSLIDEFPV